ncbi:MAG: monofunctional biosynthetic peptidoglycan transglycosylase [Sphingobacteriales bacterium]|nr:MAG: monofunctional biosynthetic peptidoglycan transglycosylase [Sphingobacteriales bacterium]
MFRLLFRTILWLFVASLGYLVLCKWMLPPVTLTQLSDRLQGQSVQYQPVKWDAISPEMKLAVIASEDQLFPDHKGFDWKAVQESMDGQRSGKGGTRPAGAAASTISQQVAKNVFLWQGTGWSRYVRKALEVPYTWLIETLWGKKRILEVYLNVAQTGTGIYGVEAASQLYFGKLARQLSGNEAARIAAALPNPVRYTVQPLSSYVKRRSDWILRQMNNLRGYPEVKKLVTD